MNELCTIIKNMVIPNFLNIKTSIQTYDRDALCCGAPCWRWTYHALHSADKWFINSFDYEEPDFHVPGNHVRWTLRQDTSQTVVHRQIFS